MFVFREIKMLIFTTFVYGLLLDCYQSEETYEHMSLSRFSSHTKFPFRLSWLCSQLESAPLGSLKCVTSYRYASMEDAMRASFNMVCLFVLAFEHCVLHVLICSFMSKQCRQSTFPSPSCRFILFLQGSCGSSSSFFFRAGSYLLESHQSLRLL